MNDYLTPEYIELCKKIQDEIEPEVGMWCHYLIETNLIQGPRQLEFVKNHLGDSILLPDLGWLVRKLASELDIPKGWVIDLVTYMRDHDESMNPWQCAGMAPKMDYSAEAITPELACLLALIRIKKAV